MSVVAWLLTRAAGAIVVGSALLALAYYLVLPTVVTVGYRLSKERPELERFKRVGGQSAAGSEDAVYYIALYDCRKAITKITGPAPDALYWMIGIYDNRFQRLRGGHLNDATAEIGEDGQFHLVIQSLPGNLSNTLECGRHGSGLILYRVFLPEDRDKVLPPSIERIPIKK
jgi:uncharacterized membrane protein